MLKYEIKKVFLCIVININMNYLISLFDCYLFDNGKSYKLQSNVKYKIKNIDAPVLVVSNSSNPFILDFTESENSLMVNVSGDRYFFIFPQMNNKCFFTSIKYKSKTFEISLSNKLIISSSGMLICERIVDNLFYSHYDIFKDFCVVYFTGARNYVVVIKDEELIFSNYYDECNVTDDAMYFMCKLIDSLNHGLVCEISNEKSSTYLVYLDDYEIQIKNEFLACVFMDCIIAGNYNYCNNLLNDDIKLKDPKVIKEFFPEFDYYYPINTNQIILINKNTLAGIFEFVIENNTIIDFKNL